MGRKSKTPSVEGLAASVESGKPETSTGAVYETAGDSTSFGSGSVSSGATDIKAKLSIPLLDGGGIDLDSMRASTRAKLESAIKSTPSLTAATGSPLSEKDCEYLYSLLSGARIFAAVKFLGIPTEIAEKVLPYTKDQVNDLVEPTRETLAMFGVGLMPPYAKLIMALVAIDMGNMMEIKIQLAKQKARAAVAGPVAVSGGLQ